MLPPVLDSLRRKLSQKRTFPKVYGTLSGGESDLLTELDWLNGLSGMDDAIMHGSKHGLLKESSRAVTVDVANVCNCCGRPL